MSLHLANLSPRIRKEELEREFRRFGRCTLQLKDGYGFVVFEFPDNAEKALRTLKGRKICGQSVYLSWSNKQPKSVQRPARVARPRDRRYVKIINREGNFRGRHFSRSHEDQTMSDKHLVDKSQESQDVFNEGGHVEVEHNQMDNGRWGEQVDHLQHDSDFDGQRSFDRYDPEFRADINGRGSPLEIESKANKRKAYNNKTSERDDQIEDTNDYKKSRQLTSSHLHSDCTSPDHDTLSRQKKPLVDTSFHSISGSRSRSRSRSPSSSVSISPGPSLPISPNKSQINLNGISDGALTSPSKKVFTQSAQHLEPEPERTSSKFHAGSNLSISTEEMCRVLKHYGLKHPEDNEQHLDLEDYFGSSRLWPWEMIYYRRLKKGSISVENYARRVAQNEEFNITDKYIRSSSGWNELIEENH